MKIREAMKSKPTDAAQPSQPDEFSYIAASLRSLAVPCASLVLDPANARKHPDKNVEAIKGSLRSFGFAQPLSANKGLRLGACRLACSSNHWPLSRGGRSVAGRTPIRLHILRIFLPPRKRCLCSG
jgi:hypothetical protein